MEFNLQFFISCSIFEVVLETLLNFNFFVKLI
jgi:hypothetical protein